MGTVDVLECRDTFTSSGVFFFCQFFLSKSYARVFAVHRRIAEFFGYRSYLGLRVVYPMVSFVFILRPSFRKILTARLQVHQSRQRLANRLPPACQAFGGNLSLGWSTVVAPRFNSSKLARRMLGGPSLIHRTCKGPRLFLLATCCRTLTLGSDT